MNKLIFLGGTCNQSTWRDQLTAPNGFEFFNPQLPAGVEWEKHHQDAEEAAKKNAAIQVYVITPEMTGVFSIAELVAMAITDREHLVVGIIGEFEPFMQKSMDATARLVQAQGKYVCRDIDDVQGELNLLCLHLENKLENQS